MEYQNFVEAVVKLLREKMGPEYTVRSAEVVKNNGIRLTGVIMMRDADKVSPTMYLEELYREFCDGAGLEEIADRIVGLYRERMRDIDLDIAFFEKFERVKGRIFYKLVNYDKNRELLREIPHFQWYDLAVVFYYAMEEEILGNASILIRNSHLAMWEKTAEELRQEAESNMRRGMPELLIPMCRLVEEVTGEKTEEAETIPMYVLTNRLKLNGASAMLYSEKLRELADELRTDLLILPSSVHEVLLLPDDGKEEYDFYRRMVEEVNTTQVDPEEVLSGQLYRYSREKEKIEEILG